MKKVTRRSFMATTAGIGAAAILPHRASAAEYNYKLACDLVPTDIAMKLMKDACDQILKDSNGRLEIRLFPNSQLGGPAEELGQIKSGALELYFLSYGLLSSVVPAASIVNLAFVFDSQETAYKAIDGELGAFMKAEAAKVNMLLVSKANDTGFRQLITGDKAIREPKDLRGFKIRVPAVPVLTSLFQALGAAPTVVNTNELYTALQTKLVEGHENSLPLLLNYKGYEVQKHITWTNHSYDAWFVMAGRGAWERLPPDLRAIAQKNFDDAMAKHRVESVNMQKSAEEFLKGKGLTFITPEKGAFRTALGQTDFYKTWKTKFGNDAWAAIERSTGLTL